jgi:archaellum biogenesis ATPase FlaH
MICDRCSGLWIHTHPGGEHHIMTTSYSTGASFGSDFSTSSKTNPCPVCGRTKDTDCRISRDGKMVLCHQNFDHTKTQQPDLWHFDKPSSDGRCGVYVFKEKTESIQPTARKSRAQKKKNQPTPIPSGAKLLRLPAPGQSPQPEQLKDAPRRVPRNALQITYEYSPTQKVVRYEWPDATNPKGRNKTYSQFHLDPDGKKDWTKGDAPWSAYRMDEVIELLKTVPDGEPIIILMPEGEHNVDIARSIGIAGLTLQGSEWSDRETQKMLEALFATGKNVSIGVLRDNDDTGIQKSKGVWLVARHIKFPCIVIDPRVLYPDIPEKGDIKEILDALGPDEFLKRLSAEIDSQSQNPPADLQNSFEQESDDNLPTKPKTKLSMREAAEEAREILRSERDELTTNIKLEEVRLKTGMGDYAWENKIIKPLKRDMDGERFKLELLSLLQMEDPVERYRQIALLAPKYSMGAGTIEKAMSAMKQRTQTLETKRLTFEDLLDSESEAIDWLVSGLLPVGETVLLCALPKVGKSKLAIDLAFSVATGESRFLGQATKQGKVLLITPDASKMSLKQELIKRGFRKQDSPNLHIFPQWSIDQMAVLEEELENFRPDLVVIDSLKKITAGKEISENSAEFADNIIALNDMLKRYRATGILVHHANKSNDAIGVERARGSTAIVGACWGTWMLERIPKKDPNNAKRMIVDPKDPKRIFTATSRDAEGTTLNIEFNLENNSWEFMGEVGLDKQEAQQQSTYQERILRVLRDNQRNLSGPEIMELMGIGREQRNSVYTVLGRMENKRLINSRPAPGDKRFNLYSLSAPKSNDAIVISLPPPPPQETVSDVDYYSETHTDKGFDNSQHNSQHNSQQIVNLKEDCASPEIAETLDNKGVNEIVNTNPLSQGGEGVKCASAEFTEQIGKAHANVDCELAVQVTPSTPANVGANHKEFTKGDRVVIAEVGSMHQGQHGEVVSVRYGIGETDYRVKLDKESRGSKQVRVTVPKGSKLTFLMKL